MNKLTCSAIALSMTCATGFASDGEWSALDQEVGALASTLSMDGGASISGLLQTAYTSDSDNDTGGWGTGNARLAVDGSHGDYGYHVETDFADENLRGAYATWAMTDSVSAQMGQFQASVCNDADLDEGSMKHFSHSAVGGAFTGFSGGLGLSGSMSDISWSLSIMNGGSAANDGVDTLPNTADDVAADTDNTGDDLLTAIRVSMDLMDGGDGGISVSANIALVDNGHEDDDDATVIEVHAGNGTWSLGVETCDTGEGWNAPLTGMDSGLVAMSRDESTMAISASYNIDANWEVALRLTDYGDDSESTEITANNYLDGHGLKWQIGMQETDDGTNDMSAMMIGLTVAF